MGRQQEDEALPLRQLIHRTFCCVPAPQIESRPARHSYSAYTAPEPSTPPPTALPPPRGPVCDEAARLLQINFQELTSATLASFMLPHMTSGSHLGRSVAKNALLALQGAQLMQLKQALERLAPGALLTFVFKHCVPCFRDEIVRHLQEQAARVPRNNIYILSDIDNTVCPSRDPRFPKCTPSYPGRAALWSVLLGTDAPNERTCFLSARFGEAVLPWKIVSKHERNLTLANLARIGITRPKVLFGNVLDIPLPTWRGGIDMSPLGEKKIKNYLMLRSLYPEFRYVFFGDTCEDDLRVGRAMLRTTPENMGAVFIHDLGRNKHDAERKDAEREGVIFYRTAPGAALRAYELAQQGKIPLRITRDHLRAIASEARREFDAITFLSPRQHAEAAFLLDCDIAAIESVLRQAA